MDLLGGAGPLSFPDAATGGPGRLVKVRVQAQRQGCCGRCRRYTLCGIRTSIGVPAVPLLLLQTEERTGGRVLSVLGRGGQPGHGAVHHRTPGDTASGSPGGRWRQPSGAVEAEARRVAALVRLISGGRRLRCPWLSGSSTGVSEQGRSGSAKTDQCTRGVQVSGARLLWMLQNHEMVVKDLIRVRNCTSILVAMRLLLRGA